MFRTMTSTIKKTCKVGFRAGPAKMAASTSMIGGQQQDHGCPENNIKYIFRNSPFNKTYRNLAYKLKLTEIWLTNALEFGNFFYKMGVTMIQPIIYSLLLFSVQ